MKRNVEELAGRTFDVVVVGGGIYGACVARDAALRGLNVALIEQSDFGGSTSHNSLKIVHGGIRYLQHLDFGRVRESISERRFWLTCAPHLVKPLLFVLPTIGYVSRGPAAFLAANILHRIVGFDWNRGVARDRRIPMGRVFSKSRLVDMAPGISADQVTGGASFYDGQMTNSDRLLIECIQSAAEHGAVVANYVRCVGVMKSDQAVHGVQALDLESGNEFEVRGKLVVNAAGPWARSILLRSFGSGAITDSLPSLSRSLNVVTRRMLDGFALGVFSKRAGDGVGQSQSRLYFVTPWKNVSIIGTTHFRFDDDPDDYRVSDAEVGDFLDEFNEAYPPARLSRDDVLYTYGGLTPMEDDSESREVVRSRRSSIVDHESAHGIRGMISLMGIKYTTARSVAERAVDLACRKLGVGTDGTRSRTTALPGATGNCPEPVKGGDSLADDLLSQYGTQASEIIHLCKGDRPVAGPEIFRACVRRAIEQECAVHLDDALLRRTDLAQRGMLTSDLLDAAIDEFATRQGVSPRVYQDEAMRLRERLPYELY